MNETAHVFGNYDHLVGVCTKPSENQHAKSVAVLMLTPGMLHHVGPFGLHVALARRLSQQGFVSLRFCLSGIGESLGVGTSGSSTDRAANEVRQAMDFLQSEFGIQRFVTFGLCSGADDSIYAALSDPRIVGTILMDGCGYRTFGYHLRKFLVRWPIKLVHRMLANLSGKSTICGKSCSERSEFQSARELKKSITMLPGEDIREFPQRRQAEREFQHLLKRGTKMLLLYTGGVSEYFNGQRQLGEMFPSLKPNGDIQCHYFPHLDHVTKLVEDRAIVIDLIAAWMSQWQEFLPSPSRQSSITKTDSQDCKCQNSETINPAAVAANWSDSPGFQVMSS